MIEQCFRKAWVVASRHFEEDSPLVGIPTIGSRKIFVYLIDLFCKMLTM